MSSEEGSVSTTPEYRAMNLRHRSFQDLALEGADFSEADLRGADFSGARLEHANFHNARLGMSPLVGALIMLGAVGVSIAAGVMAGEVFDAVSNRLTSSSWERSTGAATILLLVSLFIVFLFWRGFEVAVKVFLVVFALAYGLNAAIQLIWGDVDVAVGLRGFGLVVLFALAVFAGLVGRMVGGTFGALAIALVAIPGGVAAGRAEGGLAALVISVALVLISKRALRADPRDRRLQMIAHALVSRWGTQFVGADLTGADFTGASAEQCNVTDAVLDDIRWEPGHVPLFLEIEQQPGPG
jgi:hypothetical protein